MGGFASERELGASIKYVQQVDLAHCYVHLGLVWFPQGHWAYYTRCIIDVLLLSGCRKYIFSATHVS